MGRTQTKIRKQDSDGLEPESGQGREVRMDEADTATEWPETIRRRIEVALVRIEPDQRTIGGGGLQEGSGMSAQTNRSIQHALPRHRREEIDHRRVKDRNVLEPAVSNAAVRHHARKNIRAVYGFSTVQQCIGLARCHMHFFVYKS
jgi:hypothetical protein